MLELIFFAAAALGLAGQFFDTITTDAMDAAGGVELNPFAAFVIKHYGMVTLAILKCVLLPVAFPVLMMATGGTKGEIAAIVYSVMLAIGGGLAGYHNYKLMKENKISL